MNIKLIMMLGAAFVITSLAGTVFYYRSQYLASEVTVTQLKADKDKVIDANKSLEARAKKVKAEVERYVAAMNKMGTVNTELNRKLQGTRSKLAEHKLLKLRNGRHSELVLRVINKSIIKQQKEWMK